MTERKGTRQHRNKMIMTTVLTVIMVVCIVIVVVYFIKGKRAENTYQDIQQSAKVDQQESNDAEQEPHADYDGMPVIDFETLWETNTDICAWITVPGTEVDYPVLRKTDSTELHDVYYLMHTVDKVEGLPGSIYIEPINSPEFTDANTVVYGHNMKNGSMFGSLHNFEDDSFFEENQYAYVVTPEKSLVYQIFATIVYDNRHITGTYDFTDKEDYQKFLDSLTDNRNMGDLFREGVDVTTDDRVLTMSTCISGQDDKRLLVEAVLVDEYEN